MPFADSEESNRLRPQPLTEEDLTQNFRFSCDVPILLEPAGISQGLLTGLLRVGVNRTGGSLVHLLDLVGVAFFPARRRARK